MRQFAMGLVVLSLIAMPAIGGPGKKTRQRGLNFNPARSRCEAQNCDHLPYQGLARSRKNLAGPVRLTVKGLVAPVTSV